MIQVDPFKERVQSLLARVAYKAGGNGFAVIEKAPGVLLLQHWQHLPDPKYPACLVTQKGRKFYLSPFMTDGEILQSALLAVLLFEEHEVRENFRFDGLRLFGPHKSLAALSQVEEAPRGDVRQTQG